MLAVVENFVNQMSGYSYTAGALSTVALMIGGFSPRNYPLAHLASSAGAGWATGYVAADSDCSILKGVAGGMIPRVVLEIM